MNKKNSVKGFWYKVEVSEKEWNSFYSKLMYTLLDYGDGRLYMARWGVYHDDRMLKCDDEDLKKIQLHREVNNWFPQPFIKKIIN